MTVFKWSQTANSNDTIDSTINFKEQQSPGSLNNSSRAIMAAIAKLRDDISGKLSTAGTATAYTITTNQGWTSLTDGLFVAARIHTASGLNPTLAVDALAAKAIRIATATAVPTGRMPAGALMGFTYDLGDDCFYAHGILADPTLPPEEVAIAAGTKMLFQQTAAPTGWTKDTTHNNKALRVVSGAASSGGSGDFTSVFTSRTPAGTVGDTTLTISQIPLHGHPARYNNAQQAQSGVSGGIMINASDGRVNSTNTGGVSDSIGSQIGGTGGGASHTHSFTGAALDFAVAYVDLIIATKDA